MLCIINFLTNSLFRSNHSLLIHKAYALAQIAKEIFHNARYIMLSKSCAKLFMISIKPACHFGETLK